MSEDKPTISRANKKTTDHNWFSKTEIQQMTGLGEKPKKVDGEKIKSKVSKTSKKASQQAKKQIGRAKSFSKNPKLRTYIKKATSNKRVFTVFAGLLLAVVAVGAWSFIVSPKSTDPSEILGETVVADPDFAVLKPPETATETVFEADKQVYRYEIDYAGARVNITQQPVPEDILSGSLTLNKLALSIPDSESASRYDTGTTGLVFIVDRIGGGQTAIFQYKNDALVFMNSGTTLTKDEWITLVLKLTSNT